MGNSNQKEQPPQPNPPQPNNPPQKERTSTPQTLQTQGPPVIKNDNPIKKEDPELDPLEQQVKMVFDELIKSINELDTDIEAMIKDIRIQQQ